MSTFYATLEYKIMRSIFKIFYNKREILLAIFLTESVRQIRKLSNEGESFYEARKQDRPCDLPISGEPATGQLRRGLPGASAKAGERFARAADREAGGEAADRSGHQHRRLLLHRASIAAPAPADPTGCGLAHPDRVLDDVRDTVVPFDRRRRLHAASSCFYRERRGDDADVR